MPAIRIGVMGGSGLYGMPALGDRREHVIDTPYGAPSDAIVTGRLGGVPVAFLARHGRGHRLIPSQVPYRANIHAMKSLGVRYLLSVSAVGSLKEDIRPLDMVLVDQFIDMTKKREASFFGDGAVAHVAMARPVCAAMADILARAFRAAAIEGPRLHRAGTYVCIEGPAFSTLAESAWYRAMGAAVIGMTNMPEAKLAREAQIAYATLALVTDYDCWHPSEASVSADMAIANLTRNAENAQRLLAHAIAMLDREAPASPAHAALKQALVTPLDAMDSATRARLSVLLEN
ncbi:MAG: S-methyl-5'-thioadenosine phosphorylase [Alphaproteobacteria bacterium]|nr:MAG: S-methyl-5'-thioadenosine phosphorylase [Alphaproteobacteria bacterium]